MTTVFGKIIEGSLPSEKVYEDEDIIAIKDIAPVARVHILIMPKKSFHDLQSLPPEEFYLLGKIVAVAQKLAKEYGIEEGYRLLTNNGKGAGQTIFHLHFHLIGGRQLHALG